jgi:lysophospholipase L1-like esterase
VLRVMVLGDSFTEGQGVKEPDTYPRALERRLNAMEPGRFEVLNCGRRGEDFPALFHAFEEVLRHDPDVVVYGMVLNDAALSERFRSRQDFANDLIMDRGWSLLGKPAPEMRRFDSRLVASVKDRLEARRTARQTTRFYLDMYGEPNREGWKRTEGYLREMNRRARARGARLLLASWPLLVNMEGEDPFGAVASTVARFCVTAGIPRHDLRPSLRGHPTSSLWVDPVDMHPNEVAHALAAESLAPVVRELVSAP